MRRRAARESAGECDAEQFGTRVGCPVAHQQELHLTGGLFEHRDSLGLGRGGSCDGAQASHMAGRAIGSRNRVFQVPEVQLVAAVTIADWASQYEHAALDGRQVTNAAPARSTNSNS